MKNSCYELRSDRVSRVRVALVMLAWLLAPVRACWGGDQDNYSPNTSTTLVPPTTSTVEPPPSGPMELNWRESQGGFRINSTELAMWNRWLEQYRKNRTLEGLTPEQLKKLNDAIAKERGPGSGWPQTWQGLGPGDNGFDLHYDPNRPKEKWGYDPNGPGGDGSPPGPLGPPNSTYLIGMGAYTPGLGPFGPGGPGWGGPGGGGNREHEATGPYAPGGPGGMPGSDGDEAFVTGAGGGGEVPPWGYVPRYTGIPEFCYLGPASDKCTNPPRTFGVLKWAYNSWAGRCQKFYYSGCGGNKNNFFNEAHCTYICMRVVNGGCDIETDIKFSNPLETLMRRSFSRKCGDRK